MIKSILTFLFPKTIASIKQDGVNEYFADEDKRYFESNEERWKEIDEYEEMMRIEYEQGLESSMKTFDDLSFDKVYDDDRLYDDDRWVHACLKFDNGYGVSVVKSPISYGGLVGLYELAVLDGDGDVCYDTPITDNVIGFLKPEDVTRYMIEIQQLPIVKTK